ncbi:MAG: hypothetical protein MGF17_02690 [Trichodesmium sp. MAG_R04]|nr:hypothetical protein [Trichodesmium sp. MAG_R04]
MSNFFQFSIIAILNFNAIIAILAPALAEVSKWSTSATDLKFPPQNLTSESSPIIPSLNKKLKNSTILSDPNYIIPPHIVPDEEVKTFTTSLPLNNIPISHLTQFLFSGYQTFAHTTNNDTFLHATLKLYGRVIESLTHDNIYIVDQKGIYIQLETVPSDRKVSTTRIEPQTLSGVEMQFSLTAPCFFPDTPNNQQCTYTPGLVIDRNGIDPEFFVPTRILQTSQVGEVVKPETLSFMKLPGFQGGTSRQPIGVDLYFPNSGALSGNSESQKTQIKREEKNDYTFAGTFSRVSQILKANDTEAVIGRTIHGFTVFFDDENRGLNTVIQAGAQFLPDVIPDLKGSEHTVNYNVNRHLFLAPNNTRLPSRSFTIYSAGVARAKSLMPDVTSLKQVPKVDYHSIWLGLSPVIDRSINEGRIFYDPISPQVVSTRGGGEGGAGSNIEFVSLVNKDRFSTVNLNDFYAQIYISFLRNNVNYVRESIYWEGSRYYPHFSFTGNWTGPQDVLRYYTGVIASETVKFYLGGDYTINTVNGWNFSAGGIGYINPDRDYYSQIFGSAAKIFPMSKNANLTLSTFFNYAIDRDTEISEITIDEPASKLSINARLNWLVFSISVTYFFGKIIPDSLKDRLLLQFSIRPFKTITFSCYVAPIDKTSNRSPYGASVAWQLSNKYNNPTLSVNWQNQKYNYANDTFGNELIVTDNKFTVLFSIDK